MTLTKPIDYPTDVPHYGAPSIPAGEGYPPHTEVETVTVAQPTGPAYVPETPGHGGEGQEEQTVTSKVIVTLTVSPKPATETVAPSTPAGEEEHVPTGSANSQEGYVPGGPASSAGSGPGASHTPSPVTGPSKSTTPAEGPSYSSTPGPEQYEGAASRFGVSVGVSVVAALVAGLLLL